MTVVKNKELVNEGIEILNKIAKDIGHSAGLYSLDYSISTNQINDSEPLIKIDLCIRYKPQLNGPTGQAYVKTSNTGKGNIKTPHMDEVISMSRAALANIVRIVGDRYVEQIADGNISVDLYNLVSLSVRDYLVAGLNEIAEVHITRKEILNMVELRLVAAETNGEAAGEEMTKLLLKEDGEPEDDLPEVISISRNALRNIVDSSIYRHLKLARTVELRPKATKPLRLHDLVIANICRYLKTQPDKSNTILTTHKTITDLTDQRYNVISVHEAQKNPIEDEEEHF